MSILFLTKIIKAEWICPAVYRDIEELLLPHHRILPLVIQSGFLRLTS